MTPLEACRQYEEALSVLEEMHMGTITDLDALQEAFAELKRAEAEYYRVVRACWPYL